MVDPGGSVAAAVRAAVQGVTKAISPRAELATEAGPAGSTSTGTGPFSAIEDRVVLTWRAADNSTLNQEIPGPVDTIFITGTTKLDLTNTDVMAWETFVNLNCCSQFGQSISLVGGERTRKKQMKH